MSEKTVRKPKWKHDETRERDAWIAQNIFELPVIADSGPDYLWYIGGKDGKPNQCEHVKHYSTNPAAAMEVLKKCVEKIGWSNGVVLDKVPGKNIWLVGQEEDEETGTKSETLELAICLFANKLFTHHEL